MFEACKSTGRITSKDVSTIDSYLVGAVLSVDKALDQVNPLATLLVTDGDDGELLYLTLTLAEAITSKAIIFPAPILAPNGITVALTTPGGNGGSGVVAKCTIYYAEQYFDGHKHV